MSQPGQPTADRPRVLLLWPGGLFTSGANFGVPQLLTLAGALKGQTDALVDVVDLDLEKALGPVDFRQLLAPGYDLIGISCYSSYDYLKVMAIGAELRRRSPRSWLVTGGYHPSARPLDFTGEDSPFDYVVVGDGELPLVRLVTALVAGRWPSDRVRSPEPLADGQLITYDWELLERYRPVARQVASQAEIYLSRGCPFDCSFCMERAKREVTWRPFEPGQAVEEIHRLDRFLDLSDWTLFITDAVFGMRSRWRKAFLEELARRPCRARKLWLLIRVDLVDREDLELMARANVAPGFGLESGDPGQLELIAKTGKPQDYLDHMVHVAEWARELDVPFGANVIVGHPGETEQSLRRSASYLERLFVQGSGGTTGFLSVDPFRLYPGSPIDEHLDDWRESTGMAVHRYPWWHDGDQEFLAEWIDPSSALDFRQTLRLRRELFDPILAALPDRFVYGGPAPDYFQRAIEEQLEVTAPRRYLHQLGLWHLWRQLSPGEDRTSPSHGSGSLAEDDELATIARAARVDTLAGRQIETTPTLQQALERVPRERFVALEHVSDSAADVALPLGEDGGSTLSAMHAYVAAFEALDLGPGDELVELGGGTGYGAALASEVVGRSGGVLSVELEPDLVAAGQANLTDYPQTELVAADAHDTRRWAGATKVYVAFAIPAVPAAWLAALAPGGRLVAPIGDDSEQWLTSFEKEPGGVRERRRGPVRYVTDRRPH
ncbi:MAG: radical SAM protein [Deltaproteobacteria bacterium]|nr:radical SAM protein [Deltaproteobacteria bacterium]